MGNWLEKDRFRIKYGLNDDILEEVTNFIENVIKTKERLKIFMDFGYAAILDTERHETTRLDARIKELKEKQDQQTKENTMNTDWITEDMFKKKLASKINNDYAKETPFYIIDNLLSQKCYEEVEQEYAYRIESDLDCEYPCYWEEVFFTQGEAAELWILDIHDALVGEAKVLEKIVQDYWQPGNHNTTDEDPSGRKDRFYQAWVDKSKDKMARLSWNIDIPYVGLTITGREDID